MATVPQAGLAYFATLLVESALVKDHREEVMEHPLAKQYGLTGARVA